MIARCPECETRYRVSRGQIGELGARIRCSRCEVVFRVMPPREEPPVEVEPLPEEEPVSLRETVASVESEAAPTPPEPGPPEPAPPLHAALVVETDSELAKQLEGLLESWRIEATLLRDGAEALLHIHRRRPAFAILGGHLPGMASPMLAEVVRRTAELRDVKLLRVAPLEEPTGAPEFEANETLEPGDLPDGVEAFLAKYGFGERPEPTPQVAPEPRAQAAEPELAPVARVERARPRPSDDPQVAAAERLARIVISDIILYNEDKFREGVESGNVVELLQAEIEEAGSMFRSRVPEEIRSERDFLCEELQRRAEAARA